jgi:uncharacterized membrane protein
VLALVFGYVALFTRKGAATHRRSGVLFVAAMVTMSLTGPLMAALRGSGVNFIAGLLTFYFVATGWRTVRRNTDAHRWIDWVAMLFALCISVLAVTVGRDLASRGRPETAPMFLFAILGVTAAAGDLRTIQAGALRGPRRIARHLWRMCFAMWIAAASFFWGPPGRAPAVINIPALLPIPVLLPIAVMLYWLWRIRIRRSLQGIVGISPSREAAMEKR